MRLQDYLHENKITITDFAEFLGIHKGYLSRLLRGWNKPSKLLAEKIEYVTKKQVTVEDLMSIPFDPVDKTKKPKKLSKNGLIYALKSLYIPEKASETHLFIIRQASALLLEYIADKDVKGVYEEITQ